MNNNDSRALLQFLKVKFKNQAFPHDERLIRLFFSEKDQCESWCTFKKFHELKEVQEAVQGNLGLLIHTIQQTGGLETNKSKTAFRRTQKLRRHLASRIRDQFHQSFKDKFWLKKTELHQLRKKDGWIFVADLVTLPSFKKVCSVEFFSIAIVRSIVKEFREQGRRFWDYYQTSDLAIRRKYIHPSAKEKIRENLEKTATHLKIHKLICFEKVINEPLMIHTKQMYSCEIGKYSWEKLVWLCSRYSRVVEFSEEPESGKPCRIRLRRGTLAIPLNTCRHQPKWVCKNKLPYDRDNRDFRVTSYNVLADSLTESRLFPWTTKTTRDWKRRRWRVMDCVWRLGGSLVCLQEVQKNHKEFFLKQFRNLGFNCVYLPKMYPPWQQQKMKQHLTRIGNFIAWEAKRWEFVDDAEIPLRELDRLFDNDKDKKKFALAQVGLLVTLRRKNSNKLLNICTTHLSANWKNHDIQLLQAYYVLRRISELVGSNEPLIFCGDFNTTPDSATYEFLSKGRLITPEFREKYNNRPNFPVKEFSHNLGLVSAHSEMFGHEPELTNCVASTEDTTEFADCLDYIFFNKHVDLRAVRSIPDKDKIKSEFALPNHLYPSDHIPIQAAFRLGN